MFGNSSKEITEFKDDRMATVDILGVTRDISLDLTPQANIGDFVLVHAGFAIEVVDEQYAQGDDRSHQTVPRAGNGRCASSRCSGACFCFAWIAGALAMDLSQFKDPKLARGLIDSISAPF